MNLKFIQQTILITARIHSQTSLNRSAQKSISIFNKVKTILRGQERQNFPVPFSLSFQSSHVQKRKTRKKLL